MNRKVFLAAAFTAGVVFAFIPSTVLADSSGWRGNDSDGWRYYTSETDYVHSDWEMITGNWYYFGEDGIALSDTWEMIDGKMYHFRSSGAMDRNKWIPYRDYGYELQEDIPDTPEHKQYAGKKMWRYVGDNGAAYTGWKKVDGTWYYFNTDEDYNPYADLVGYEGSDYGAMYYGWLEESDGSSYCFDGNGEYYRDCYLDWTYFNSTKEERSHRYCFDPDGRLHTGWKKDGSSWLYFGPYMYQGSFGIDGARYYFNNSGKMVTGWYDTGSYWVYARADGRLYHDEWARYNGDWYFFDPFGLMIRDITNYKIDGKYYDFNSKGICTNPYSGKTPSAGWFRSGGTYGELVYYNWLYFEEDGTLHKGWLELNGKKYYLNPDNGCMYQDDEQYIDGNRYVFNGNGEMVTGWYNLSINYGGEMRNVWVYAAPDGILLRNEWLSRGGNWYYFDGYYMAASEEHFCINGRYYDFDENGVCLNPHGDAA